MIMIRKTAVRILCCGALGALLLTCAASAQDRSDETRRITLDEAQAQAATAAVKNLGQLGINAARYQRQAAQADYFPKLNADFINLHYNKIMGQQIQIFQRQASVTILGKDQTAALFTVLQPVTQLLQVKQAVNVARADEEIARAKAVQMKSQIAENVERIYFGLLIAQRRQTIAEQKVRMLESKSRLVSTVATPVRSDAEHESAFREASKELIAASSEVDDLARSLNTLVGFRPDTKLILAIPEPTIETVSLPQATQQAVASSPQVVEAQQTVVKARAASKLAKLEYIPAVTVLGGYVYEPQRVIPLLPIDFSFIGFTATYNVFDFGKREKTISERNTQVQMAEGNLELVKAKVAAGVQKSFFDLERTQKIRDLTRRLAAGYQEASLENTSARAEAEADMFQAELDYRSAYAEFKRLIDGK